MSLRCYNRKIKCPPYKHQGTFIATDTSVRRLFPDLHRCAKCIAYANPQRLDLQAQFFSAGCEVLVRNGPLYDPRHRSSANFGSFIRPKICGTLMNEKRRELEYSRRASTELYPQWNTCESVDAEINHDIGLLWEIPDPVAEFEDEVIWNIFVQDFEKALPILVKKLTPMEQRVFALIRENRVNSEIAAILERTPGRISQLTRQVAVKLRKACKELGLVE